MWLNYESLNSYQKVLKYADAFDTIRIYLYKYIGHMFIICSLILWCWLFVVYVCCFKNSSCEYSQKENEIYVTVETFRQVLATMQYRPFSEKEDPSHFSTLMPHTNPTWDTMITNLIKNKTQHQFCLFKKSTLGTAILYQQLIMRSFWSEQIAGIVLCLAAAERKMMNELTILTVV